MMTFSVWGAPLFSLLVFLLELKPYNARNGAQAYMFDPVRVACVMDDDDIVTEVHRYTYLQ
jgi:hypothetical protein